MKKQVWRISNRFLLPVLLAACTILHAAAQADTTVKEQEPEATEVVKLSYHSRNNSMQYLLLKAILKKGKEQQAIPGKTYDIYLDSVAETHKAASVKTDAGGMAKAFVPVSLKETWDASSRHLFIVVAGEEELINDYSITKAKIRIDTATTDGLHSITVTVQKQEGAEWVPAADVELKIGIQRLGGILPASEEPSYTTDSSGTVTVEVKNDRLPGDEKGNIVLAARADDNEFLGNLLVEQEVPWGIQQAARHDFFAQRTLWSTRFRTPIWLLILAYSIVIGVWGTLIYLLLQLVKIKKLGKQAVG